VLYICAQAESSEQGAHCALHIALVGQSNCF
jgi:hypothetical protein